MTTLAARFLPAPLAATILASGDHAFDVATWSPGEWILYGSMTLACVWVLWRAVRTTVAPGEDTPDHVKRIIFDDDSTPFGGESRPAPPGTRV
jgi:hypothetical protein